MEYVLLPSLEHLALVKILTTLWNENDIRALTGRSFPIPRYTDYYQADEWKVVRKRVLDKVPQLLLPRPLEKVVLDFIKPIGWKILKWKDHLKRSLFETEFVRECLYRLYWTPQGSIDKKKTAENIIKDDNLDISMRYKLACIYCLEKDVLTLWNSLPENLRSFYSEKDPQFIKQPDLVVLWTYDVKGEIARLDNMFESWRHECTPYQYALESSAKGGNKAATEYFFKKLKPEETEESLVKAAGSVVFSRRYSFRTPAEPPDEDYADVLCFLFSKMNEEQQLQVCKSYPYEVLRCLLDWPWQCFYMETANRIWDVLSVGRFYDLLCDIVEYRVTTRFRDCNYQQLFREFWQKSPKTHKEHVIEVCAEESRLLDLLEVEDKEILDLILETANIADREKICFQMKNL